MAKKNVSAVVSGLGLGLGILEGLVAAIREEGGSDEDIHRLGTDEGRKILAAMAKLAVVRTGDDLFTARFQAAIKACHFDWVSDYATPRNFPVSVFGEVGEGHVLAQPPKTKGYWTEAEVNSWLAEKAKEGLEAATLADGLDFVAKNPQTHRDGPVVFWASVSSGGGVACLLWCGRARGLSALGRGRDCFGDFRFLLRKVQP